jgi:glutamine phosphoribosylpyrophosphate amidotransferase
MCVICISKKGVKQPTKDTLKAMFKHNPDGAGYMVARNGKVEIHKGFMDFQEFWANVASEQFTKDDVTVFHCRISTQAGINREMCHPFAFTDDIVKTKALDVVCNVGIAHNGIIRMTSNGDKEYSDTAHFIAEYLPHIVRNYSDLKDKHVLRIIDNLINSRMVFLNGSGEIATVGNWTTDKDGLMFSNTLFRPSKGYQYYPLSFAANYR